MSNDFFCHRVSIIIPNYMHRRFLEERIQSVLSQTFQDFEIIILDDGSTDGSRDLIESYRTHPKVSHIHFNEENTGKPFQQWKRGMESAQGELIWIAESDDVAKAEFLETMVQAFDRYPGLVLATAMLEYIDENGRSLGCVEEDLQGTYDGVDVLAKGLGYRNCIRNASAVVFDKQVGMAYIDYAIGRRFSGDWHFWALLAMHPGARMHFNHSILCYYRLHGNSVHGQVRGRRSSLRAIESIAILCNINLHSTAASSRNSNVRKFIALNDDIWFWIYGIPSNSCLLLKMFLCAGNLNLMIFLSRILILDMFKKVRNRILWICRGAAPI